MEEILETGENVEVLVEIWIPPVDGSTEQILNRVTLEDETRSQPTGAWYPTSFSRVT